MQRVGLQCMIVVFPAHNQLLFFKKMIGTLWASKRGLSSGFANNKGADQPAHPRRLISAFVIRYSESIISKLATSKIPIFPASFCS